MTSPIRSSEWRLERRRLGEGEGGPALAEDAKALEALNASDRDILERYPPARVAEEVARRARGREGGPGVAGFPWAWISGTALALGLTLFAVRSFPGADPADAEVTRDKGLAPRLSVYRQGRDRPEPLPPGSPARARDVVQLSYRAAGRSYGVVLSVDGRGRVTAHHPGTEASTPLEPSGEVPLPGAYELDDAPGFERFFLVTSDAPFDPAPVFAAARSLALHPDAATRPLTLPGRLGQTSFTLIKVSP
ncbi:MAG TPA: ActD-like protein [Myxococcaceae bacterium]|nr:ActD-like protein [Myxococcaceae bacterium]